MRETLAFIIGTVVLLAADAAQAHFKLVQPGDALETDEFGDPVGGEQKSEPCGRGTMKTGQVTQVRAGELLHIQIVETVTHGGHYRIALASDRLDFVDPEPVVEAGNCVSAPTSTKGPVLADGLFEHGQDDVAPGQVWETDVRIPNTPCSDCTLQIIEFMTPHPPSCFYHHCARLEILPAATPDDLGPPGDGPGPTQEMSGCDLGQAARHGAWWLSGPPLALAALLLLARRHRRTT